MSKFIDAEEITPIMAEYVADVFSRKNHLDDISYGYCMEIADVFRRYAERAKQPEKSKKDCNGCPHCVDRKDQYGWHFKGCFGGPYNGKFIAEIDECPLKQEQLPGIEEHGIPGKDFIPVEWVDACEKYGKWKIVRQVQPSLPDNLDEVAWQYAEQEVKTWGSTEPDDKKEVHDDFIAGAEWDREQMMKASRNVYESWMGGTMDDVRRDMVELGKALNARKEEENETQQTI